MSSAPSPWFPWPAAPTGALALVVVPHAGGSASAARRWQLDRLTAAQAVPMQLPGREQRLSEPALTDLEAIVADALPSLVERVGRSPYALLGYSMGALVARELALAMRRHGAGPPRAMIVAACRAPNLVHPERPLHLLPDEALVDEVRRRFGGIPQTALDHPELIRLLLPTLRADLQVVETYRYRADEPLDCPLLALGGSDDLTVSAAALSEWRGQTRGPFSMRHFPGGHFFIDTAAGAALRCIERFLAELAPGGDRA